MSIQRLRKNIAKSWLNSSHTIKFFIEWLRIFSSSWLGFGLLLESSASIWDAEYRANI